MLNLLLLAGILGIATRRALRAQGQSLPKFEVASVRRSAPLQLPLTAGFRSGMFLDARRVDFMLMTPHDLMLVAYRIKPYQLAGGPDWFAGPTEVFDIHATIPQGVSAAEVPDMLQALLAERFGLRIRREYKEMPVYALTVGKGGPKFRESPPDDPQAEPVFPKPPDGGFVAGFGGAANPTFVRIGPAGGRGDGSPVFDGRGHPTVESLHMEIPRATMERLAYALTSMVDRPVVDRTGLTGQYEIGFDAPSQEVTRAVMLHMPGKIPRAVPPPDDTTGGSIFQSVQGLGLRLEKDKAAIETIVVEHIEKNPTEN